MFEIVGVPYVGCEILASSVAMDKVYTKIILDRAGINQAKSIYVRKYEDKYIYMDKEFNEKTCTISEVCNITEDNLSYPMFVKPSNSGSSVGVSKAVSKDGLEKAIKYASEFDKKVIIEQEIIGKEVECAVLGNEEVIAGAVR